MYNVHKDQEEEVRAQNIMAQLGSMLKEWKDNAKTNGADLEHTPKKLNTGGKTYLRNVIEQSEKACLILSTVQDIENLLTKLPASKRAEIQPCFSSLRAEANIVIIRIMDFIQNQCERERATMLGPSS